MIPDTDPASICSQSSTPEQTSPRRLEDTAAGEAEALAQCVTPLTSRKHKCQQYLGMGAHAWARGLGGLCQQLPALGESENCRIMKVGKDH